MASSDFTKRSTTNASVHDSNSIRNERRLYDEAPSENLKGPLTVFAKAKVVKAKVKLYETWAREVAQFQRARYEGFLGSEVIKPMGVDSNEFVTIFRYDTYEHLQRWMDSQERDLFLQRTREFTEEPVQVAYHSLAYGCYVQDDIATTSSTLPSKHKMSIVTFLVIWLQVHFIPPLVSRIPNLPELASEALTTALIVVLTSYLILPIITTRVLAWWLFPKQKKDKAQDALVEDMP
jgi:uncharacterized protein